MSLLETDRRFGVMSEALASRASERNAPRAQIGERLETAVSVVVRARDDLDFLLIKRATSERDPWSGHMALPGGRREPTDSGLLQTAERETLEETGVDLQRVGFPLGRLSDVATSGPHLPKLLIAPYVFGVPADTEALVASHEVERVYWIPLDTLRSADTLTSVEIPLPGGPRMFPSYNVVGEHIWGLTHRILAHFLEVYPGSELEKLGST